MLVSYYYSTTVCQHVRKSICQPYHVGQFSRDQILANDITHNLILALVRELKKKKKSAIFIIANVRFYIIESLGWAWMMIRSPRNENSVKKRTGTEVSNLNK